MGIELDGKKALIAGASRGIVFAPSRGLPFTVGTDIVVDGGPTKRIQYQARCRG